MRVVAELLDLEEEINMDQIEAPLCEAKFGASVSMFDHLPSIADKEKLDYSSENVLKDVIQMLGTKEEDVEIVGTRISKALAKNPTSWALGCLGALYWRVQGHAPNAINCLRMALMYAPEESRHIPLLSLANILHKAGSLNDALEIALAALQSSPETVVIHFSIGNMYAAQNNFEKAVEYYQSTLALQEKFEPARERLMAIMCKNLINTESDANP
ncbi:TTC17 [Bugula neritina]|uniref:TTC17 n=1 Tax=Bugula neritina TaxID=10212 RepID=A0A7J7J3L0_BUGNE|nr:TTC17 [Bugula neritina]